MMAHEEYTVKSDWLYDRDDRVPEVAATSDKTSSGRNICDFVIMHYTAGETAKGAHDWYQNPASKVSWHLTIDRNGMVYQLMDFRKIAWHAGNSSWTTKAGRTYNSINRYGVGIEMANLGPLTKKPDGSFRSVYDTIVDERDVFLDKDGNPWHRFTNIQAYTAVDVALAVAKAYKCVDILGHHEISPGRKVDPGPAFQEFLELAREQLRSAEWYIHETEK